MLGRLRLAFVQELLPQQKVSALLMYFSLEKPEPESILLRSSLDFSSKKLVIYNRFFLLT